MDKNQLLAFWKTQGEIIDTDTVKAFEDVDRTLFVPEELKDEAYEDRPLPIGKLQTISQPTTVMIMTQALQVKQGMNVLEIGCGSGYQAALLASIVGPEGQVTSIELLKELVEVARNSIKKAGLSNVDIIEGDGSCGWQDNAPYDRIIVTAAAPNVPEPLEEQLMENGIIVIPVGNRYGQKMNVGKKVDGKMEYKLIGDFVFVPLLGKYGFNESSS